MRCQTARSPAPYAGLPPTRWRCPLWANTGFGSLAALPPVRWAFGRYLRFLARNIDSIHSLHRKLHQPVKRLIGSHSDSLELGGVEPLLQESHPRLFLSNHRDIALDPLLLGLKLFEAGHKITRVVIGDNLLQLPVWGSLMMRAIGCFMVDRTSDSSRQQYQNHKELSGYIRYLLTEEKTPIWLAQRSGRSLDGKDVTDPTVLKMLHLCDRKVPFSEHMASIRVVPMSISYEYDPCDRVKAERLHAMEADQPWQSDYSREALDGLLGNKGRIHIQLGEELLRDDWGSAEEMAVEMDRHIQSGYKLWPTAFAAAQKLDYKYRTDCPWSSSDLERATRYLDERCEGLAKPVQQKLLQYYTNPLIAKDQL